MLTLNLINKWIFQWIEKERNMKRSFVLCAVLTVMCLLAFGRNTYAAPLSADEIKAMVDAGVSSDEIKAAITESVVTEEDRVELLNRGFTANGKEIPLDLHLDESASVLTNDGKRKIMVSGHTITVKNPDGTVFSEQRIPLKDSYLEVADDTMLVRAKNNTSFNEGDSLALDSDDYEMFAGLAVQNGAPAPVIILDKNGDIHGYYAGEGTNDNTLVLGSKLNVYRGIKCGHIETDKGALNTDIGPQVWVPPIGYSWVNGRVYTPITGGTLYLHYNIDFSIEWWGTEVTIKDESMELVYDDVTVELTDNAVFSGLSIPIFSMSESWYGLEVGSSEDFFIDGKTQGSKDGKTTFDTDMKEGFYTGISLYGDIYPWPHDMGWDHKAEFNIKDTNMEGEVYFSYGYAAEASLLGLVGIDVSYKGGVVMEGETIYGHNYPGDTEHKYWHECDAYDCLNGDGHWRLGPLSLEAFLGPYSSTIKDMTDPEDFDPFTHYYVSDTFGDKSMTDPCPHKGYRINAKVQNPDGKKLEGIGVSYDPVTEHYKEASSRTTDENGEAWLYAPADAEIDVTASATSSVDPSVTVSETKHIKKKDDTEDLEFTLNIPEKHVYFRNPEEGIEADDWPKDISFMPFYHEDVTLPDLVPKLAGHQFVGWNTKEGGSGTEYMPGDKLTLKDDLTLYSKWIETDDNWYVIYNANGGKNAPGPTAAAKGEEAKVSYFAPTADTMYFKGWVTDPKHPKPIYKPGDKLPYDSTKKFVVLYAMWNMEPVARPVHIFFDANGVESAEIPADIWTEQGGWYQLKSAVAPLGSAYTFKGWSIRPKATDPEYLPNNSYCFYRDTTLYAIWGYETKTLTFEDTQSGSATGIPETITIWPSMSPSVKIPDQIPEKSGRVFLGWNTKEDGGGTDYAPGSKITLDDNITLWAQWKEAGNSWYVIYNANGGTKAPRPQIVTRGEDAELSQELPVLGTLIFKGWTPDLKSKDPVFQKGDTLPYDSEKTVVVLYALWELSPAKRPVHIIFDANGAENIKLPEDIWIEYGECHQLEKAIALLGGQYTFRGWSEDPGSSEPQYKAGKYYYFDEDTVLFAIWEEVDTKTLTFMDQSPYTATGMPQQITVNPSMSQTVQIPTQVPKKPGRFFTGWNTAKDGSGKSYRPGSEITLESSMHLWAQWDLEAISLSEAHVTVLIDPYPFAPDPENPKEVPKPPIRVMLYGEEVPAQYYDAVYEKSRSEVKPWSVRVIGKGEYTDESYWSYFAISDDTETFTYELVPDQTYTGKALKPHVNVYFAGIPLTEKKDYTITYKDNVNAYRNKANNATFIIKGKGNYSGTEEGSFSILPRSVLDEGVSISEIDDVVYNPNRPKVYKPVPKITYNRKSLKKERDFTVKYYTDEKCTEEIEDPQEIGRYYVKIEGIGNFTETDYRKFDIIDPALKPVSKLTVGRIPDQPYTGETISVNDLNLLVKDGSKALVMGEDYTAETWSVDAGKGEVLITGRKANGYTGYRTVSYNIIGIPVNKVTVTQLPKTVVYNGSQQKPKFTLSYKKNSASEAETISYTTKEKYDNMSPDKQKKIGCIVSYGENTKVGTGTVTLTGVNKCSGTVKKTFKIAKYDISPEKDTENALTVTLSQSEYPFTKGGVKPKPVVRFYQTVLVENRDYTVSYANNKKLNDLSTDVKPTVIINGKGSFKGKDATAFFKIVQADMATEGISVVAADVLYKDKAGNWKTKVEVVDKAGKKLAAGTDYDKDILFKTDPEGELVIGEDAKLDPGTTVYVIVKAKEGSDYSGSVTGSYRIVNKDIGKLSATIEPKEYTGEEIKLKKSDISWKQGGKPVTLSEEDFDIIESTYKNNINKGKATVVVRGKGEWGCTKTISFKIGTRGFIWWIKNRLL